MSLPDGATVYRTVGPWDADSLPAGLRRTHRTKDGVWARLRVLEGAVTCVMHGPPEQRVRVVPGQPAAVAPGAPHHLELTGPVRLELDFLRLCGSL